MDGNRDTFWCPEEGTEQAVIEVDLQEVKIFNHIVLQEDRFSQQIERFELEYLENGEWKSLWKGTVIG